MRESQAQEAYGRRQADRRATPAEIDASVRRTSAPPPMMRPPIADARTEQMSQPPRIARAAPAPIFDDAADTHLDLPVVPPEFLASVLADRGSGDLIADLDLASLDSPRPGRPLARPPRPAVPAELRAMADPTIDEALLDLAPTEEVPVELGPDGEVDQAGFSSTLAGAAWIEPEHSLAKPDLRPLRPPIAPPSAWAEPPTIDHYSRTPPHGTPPRGPSLPGLADPTLRDLPRANPGRLPAATAISPPGAAGAPGATGRPRSGMSPAPRGNSGPPSSRLTGSSVSPRPLPSGSGDLPPRSASLTPRDDSGQIRRVDDPSLDEIIQGYLDTKRRR